MRRRTLSLTLLYTVVTITLIVLAVATFRQEKIVKILSDKKQRSKVNTKNYLGDEVKSLYDSIHKLKNKFQTEQKVYVETAKVEKDIREKLKFNKIFGYKFFFQTWNDHDETV